MVDAAASATSVMEDLLIFPARAGRNWHRDRARDLRVAGCRGFNGPFPLPLWMSHMQLGRAGEPRGEPSRYDTVGRAPKRCSRSGSRVTGTGSRLSVPCASMAAMTASPLHLVLGEEELLVERAVEAIVAEVRLADPTAELRRFRAAELTPVELADSLSPSLFAEARVIVLQAAHEAGKELAAAIVEQSADPAEGVVLVVQHAGGGPQQGPGRRAAQGGAATVVTCNKITRYEERADFVRGEVRRAGGRIAPAAVGVLIEAVGSDLRELAAATGQLVADTGGTVDEQAVRRYHRGRAEATGFAVADKAVAGDRAGALEALRWASCSGCRRCWSPTRWPTRCARWPRSASAGRGDPNRLAGVLGMPPWKIRKAQSQVRVWRPESLAVAFDAAAEVNADVKGVAADAGYALQRAVLRICAARESR